MNVKKALASFEAHVPLLATNRRYWFVRTDGGENYDSFKHGGYIAIGWNEILLESIRKRRKDGSDLKLKIAKAYNYNLEDSNEKSSVTAIATKLIRFTEEIKAGDVVIIPSASSAYLSFGIVQETPVFIGKTNDGCLYSKRKRVKWRIEQPMAQLDPELYRMTASHHTISDVSAYDVFIDKEIKNLYRKGEDTHLIIPIGKEDVLGGYAFFSAWSELLELAQMIADEEGIEFNKNDVKARIRVQSPGDVEFIVMAVQGAFALTLAIGALAGVQAGWKKGEFFIKTSGAIAALNKYMNDRAKRKLINRISKNLDAINVDPAKLLDAFFDENKPDDE